MRDEQMQYPQRPLDTYTASTEFVYTEDVCGLEDDGSRGIAIRSVAHI